jgi:heme-degrading monooxygenase HmoA
MTSPSAQSQALTVLEAGFKIIPGKEADFFAIQGRMVPVGASQPGFISVQGGLIADSTWLYFGVRFESKAQMDAWHRHSGHQAVQQMAYAKFWTAVYLRKWRVALPGEAFGERLMCETRLICESSLDEAQLASIKSTLSGLGEAGAQRFETLTGEYEHQPYQFVGPVEITPAPSGTLYSLITHWSSHAALQAWQQSTAFEHLKRLGRVSSETFVAVVEDEQRDRLRSDRLQREWTLEGHPR